MPSTLSPIVDGLEERLALLGALGLDDLAAAEDDVLAVVVDLDDLELVDVADVFVEIFRRDDVDLRAGKEGLDADVDHEAAFDDALDLAFDEPAVVEDFDDLVPVLLVGGFLFREDDHALVVFEFLEEDFDLVADLDFFVFEFCARDGTFGFVSDVHQHDLWVDFEDAPVDDRPLAELAERLVDQGCNTLSLTHNNVVKLVVRLISSYIVPVGKLRHDRRDANKWPWRGAEFYGCCGVLASAKSLIFREKWRIGRWWCSTAIGAAAWRDEKFENFQTNRRLFSMGLTPLAARKPTGEPG